MKIVERERGKELGATPLNSLSQGNTAKLTQPRPKMAVPMHRHTAHETVVNTPSMSIFLIYFFKYIFYYFFPFPFFIFHLLLLLLLVWWLSQCAVQESIN